MIKAMLMLLFVTLFLFYRSSDSSNSYGDTSKAFFFSLSNNEDLQPFKSIVAITAVAIYKRPSYGPVFGNGYDFAIADQANSNTDSSTNFGGSYRAPSGVRNGFTILAGRRNFTPDDWEVFYLA